MSIAPISLHVLLLCAPVMKLVPFDMSSHLFLESLKHALINRIWTGLLLVVVVSIPFSVVQYNMYGWSVAYLFHGLLLVLSLLMVLGRRGLTLDFKASVLGLVCLVVGIFGLSQFGLLATEWSYTVLGIIVVGVVLSGKAAVVMFVMAVLVMGAFMWAYTTGELVFSVDAVHYHKQYYPWFLAIFASMVLPAFVLQQIRLNQRALTELLGEVERQRDVIAEQVYYDELTGLPSRRLVLDRIDMAFKRLAREDSCSALLFIDLDGFKDANDRYGHAAGDEVLRVVGQRMRHTVRGDDTVARYAGDEYLVILNLVGSMEHAAQVARRLIEVMEQPILFEGSSILISASIGIKMFTGHDELTRETLIIFADEAMYEAKNQGKGRYMFYHGDQQQGALHHVKQHSA